MIYTLFLKDIFKQMDYGYRNLGKQRPMKQGRAGDYEGSIVFRTWDEAEQFKNENGLDNLDILGVEAEWGVDTAQSQLGNYHVLLTAKPLVEVNRLWTPR